MTLKTMRAKLARNGYVLRKKGDGYLIVDDRNIPVHETHMTPYSQSLEDVRFWVAELCD